MDNVNIGIIGCGAMARDLARRCGKLGRCRISAVSDPNPDTLAEAASEFVASAERDVESLCRRPDVDAVIVGSPPGAHLENVLAAAANRKEVYCEKPLALSIAQCDRMIRACADSGVGLFVGQVLRLFPLFWQSHELIRAGVLGEPRAISVTRTGYGPLFHSGWRTSRAMTGGLLFEINAHELDYMRSIMGEPVAVYARASNVLGKMEYDDQVFGLVEFAGGGHGLLHSSMSSPIGEYRVSIQCLNGNIVHSGFGGSLRYQTIRGDHGEFTTSDVSVSNPYDRELASWLDSITLGTVPMFTGADGRAAVAMAEAAYRSAESGRPILLSEL